MTATRKYIRDTSHWYHYLKKFVLSQLLSVVSEFLDHVGISVEEEEMLDWLRQSVARSAAKRYHGDKGIEVLSPEGMLDIVPSCRKLLSSSFVFGQCVG